MKLTLKVSLVFALLAIFSFPATAVTTTINTDQDVFVQMMSQLSPQQIIDLDRNEIEAVIGNKLTLKERGGLILGKYKINRLLKKGFSEDQVRNQMGRGDFSFSIWGFLLGFFLPLLGILIAWLIWGKKGLKSAIIGSLFGLLLGWLGYRRL